ncbi:DUF6557 family protein [Lactobacillus sp. ESL0230]|uniref:DUF6557 family protein n=1 Tax=Lactobacillus sp. ESL0230 TaxID=2069353 RepID=UPI0035150838
MREKGGDAQSFDYIMTEQAEVMGYHIADNKLTKYYLTELLTDIMYETSFFGFKQEHLQAEIKQLQQAYSKLKRRSTKERR